MGIDVNLYAEGDVSDERLAEANAYLAERLGPPDEWADGGVWLIRPDYPYERQRVELYSLNRYWGPGYERGPWPIIYSHIRALKAALPECTIHYGGDTDDDCAEIDDSTLAEFWDHWVSPDGDAYHRHPAAAQESVPGGA